MGIVYNNYDDTVADPHTFRQLAVKDALFLYYRCPQVDKHVQLFSHYNEIMFTLSGSRTMHHSGKSWTLGKHSCLLTRKTAYLQELPDVVGWEVLAFYFQDDFFRQVFNEYRQYLPLTNLPEPPRDMLMEINVNETTKAFFYSILPYFKQKLPPAEGLLELKFKELLFNIFLDPVNAGLLAYVNSIMDQQKIPLWEVMDANYMFNLTITQFARMAHRSVSAFKTEFQQYYNTSPGKWLTQKRLEHAKLLLDTSGKSVSDVAFVSGFENLSHFSRVFKEKYGTSPLQYKKREVDI
ncbi:helix-turn-helix transcriptional regulator [Negadavirga shengliensis]|uniref:Helix-turn-helix transcriptional regulator n=1 Tax=Negadavirga shengliensis TaxID=1389218 RepID=A0ABV9T8P3_9BACT